MGNGAELYVKTPVSRRYHFATRSLHWAFHGTREVGHRACKIILTEKNLVGIVDQMVVREGLEEFDRFCVMIFATSSGFGLSGPVNSNVVRMTLSECLP